MVDSVECRTAPGARHAAAVLEEHDRPPLRVRRSRHRLNGEPVVLLTHHLASGGGPARLEPRRRRREVMSEGPSQKARITSPTMGPRIQRRPEATPGSLPARADRGGDAAPRNSLLKKRPKTSSPPPRLRAARPAASPASAFP